MNGILRSIAYNLLHGYGSQTSYHWLAKDCQVEKHGNRRDADVAQ